MARKYITAAQKQELENRAHSRCEYCKCHKEYATHTFNVEHIIPVSAEGPTLMDNLALACSGCNSCKSNRLVSIDPLSKKQVALFHPRKQKWRDHFIWSENGLKIVGITATGRATAHALRLNRPGVINLRRLMLLADLHPPEQD